MNKKKEVTKHRESMETLTSLVHKEVITEFKMIALQESTPLYLIINEALAVWLKWNRKDEHEERAAVNEIEESELQDYQKEMLKTQELIEQARREKISLTLKSEKKKFKSNSRRTYARGHYKKHAKNPHHNQGTDEKPSNHNQGTDEDAWWLGEM